MSSMKPFDSADILHLQRQVADSERFAQATLDALDSNIAILGERGIILAVNQAWRAFAAENGMPPDRALVGVDYLAVCDAAQGMDQADARVAAAGIRAVLAGERPSFQLEYPCHSPVQERWFILRVTRFGNDGPPRAVAAHIDITERRKAEELARQYQEQLRRLNSEMMLSEERQRRQLASELHDGLAQDLVAALQAVRRYCAGVPSSAGSDELGLAESLLRHAVRQIQTTVFSLSPIVLYELGLPAALETLCRHVERLHQLPCQCRTVGETVPLAGDLEVLVFQVARELLTNAGRHASAGQATIMLEYRPDAVRLTVEDDGAGFNPNAMSSADGTHFGLLSIRERVRFAGGQFDIDSTPGQGTRVSVSVSVPRGDGA